MIRVMLGFSGVALHHHFAGAHPFDAPGYAALDVEPGNVTDGGRAGAETWLRETTSAMVYRGLYSFRVFLGNVYRGRPSTIGDEPSAFNPVMTLKLKL